MHSYGHAEAARLQTLRRDVERILAKAGAEAMPAANWCVPPPAPSAGQEQPAFRPPFCDDPDKRAACPSEESARPPITRRELGGHRPHGQAKATASALSSPPRRPRSVDLSLRMQAHVAAPEVRPPTIAAQEPKGEHCRLSRALITPSVAPALIVPPLPLPNAGPGSCCGHDTATSDIPPDP